MNTSMHEWGLGIWGAHAADCLQWLSWGGLLLFGLPLLIMPLRWARLLGWAAPAGEQPSEHLALYFGRTLGMLSCVVSIAGLAAVKLPALHPALFNITFMIFAANTLIHAWGAVRRIQPLSETWEIPYWAALAGVQYLFYPGAHWRWV
jgi:hypothetical protein